MKKSSLKNLLVLFLFGLTIFIVWPKEEEQKVVQKSPIVVTQSKPKPIQVVRVNPDAEVQLVNVDFGLSAEITNQPKPQQTPENK